MPYIAVNNAKETKEAKQQESKHSKQTKQDEEKIKRQAGELQKTLDILQKNGKELQKRGEALKQERDDAQRLLGNSFILLAEQAWKHNGDPQVARHFLDQVPPAVRKWEWGYLTRKYAGGL